MTKKRNKYGNRKVKTSAGTFDSALEKNCHDLLTNFKIPFKAQVEWELMPKYKSWDGKAIRRMYMKVDFVIKWDDLYIFIDTKGFATDVAKIKYKLLGYQLQQSERKHEIHWLKNKKEVQNFVIDLYDKMKNDEEARKS